VWEVLGSHKSKVGDYGIRAREEEEAPTNKKRFFIGEPKGGA
jgi:hypothetical protein